MPAKERNLNIELLRIIAIIMVLMLHFNADALHPDVIWQGKTPFSWLAVDGHLIESFCIAAVNIFVLISGYFSIRLSFHSVIRLYLRCLIIGLITYLAYVFITGDSISLSAIAGRFLAFTHNHWWFVISYLGLMAISPILNAGCAALDKRTYLYMLIMLSVVMLYFGWWKHMEATHNGYSLINFIYLYTIARYIRLHVPHDFVVMHRWLWFTLFIISGLCITFGAFFYQDRLYQYDSPLTILSAIFILLFFIAIPFHSNKVNWVATSVFSAYLIQESPYFGKLWLYPLIREAIQNNHDTPPDFFVCCDRSFCGFSDC